MTEASENTSVVVKKFHAKLVIFYVSFKNQR